MTTPVNRKQGVTVMFELGCEFCDELMGRDSRFHRQYKHILESRIIFEDDDFVALPTMGQLFRGSLLFVTKTHVETMTDLPVRTQKRAQKRVWELADEIRSLGAVFVYEHGARANTGSSCGVCHAHVHLVPLPRETEASQLLKLNGTQYDDLVSAWAAVVNKPEYLVAQSIGRCPEVFVPSRPDAGFGSQYCRKQMAEFFGLRAPWDWRQYGNVEPFLLETVRQFMQEGVLER